MANYDNKPPEYGYNNYPDKQVVMQQPGPQYAGTTVIVQQAARVEEGTRGWSSGICSCCDDMTSCCLGAFFPGCYLCCLASQYNECCCTPYLIPAPIMAMRIQHRNRHKIYGTLIDDCMISMCCPHCAICQLKRDMDYVIQTKGTLEM